jgi:hypothetical protein
MSGQHKERASEQIARQQQTEQEAQRQLEIRLSEAAAQILNFLQHTKPDDVDDDIIPQQCFYLTDERNGEAFLSYTFPGDSANQTPKAIRIRIDVNSPAGLYVTVSDPVRRNTYMERSIGAVYRIPAKGFTQFPPRVSGQFGHEMLAGVLEEVAAAMSD